MTMYHVWIVKGRPIKLYKESKKGIFYCYRGKRKLFKDYRWIPSDSTEKELLRFLLDKREVMSFTSLEEMRLMLVT